MTDRTRLAERLHNAEVLLENEWPTIEPDCANSPDGECGPACDSRQRIQAAAADVREAAEWLTRGCETCRWAVDGNINPGEAVLCEVGLRALRNCHGCNAWEGRARP
jgi:hypothetical protein